MDFREKIVHGNEAMPIAIYPITPEHIRYRMNLHWHPEHEILYMQSGTLHLRLNDTFYPLKAGDTVFFPGGTIHSAEPKDCRYTCILVNLPEMMKKSDACMEFVNRIQNGTVRVRTLLDHGDGQFAELCEKMIALDQQRPDGYPFLMKGLIFSFFGTVLNQKCYAEGETAERSWKILSGRMKPAIRHMETNYSATIRLDELAQLVNMTPNYFCKCFRDVTGQTPIGYLMRYRLTRAQYALKTTDLTVTETALECGFNDVSHFIRMFREIYGVTPKQYRKELKK